MKPCIKNRRWICLITGLLVIGIIALVGDIWPRPLPTPAPRPANEQGDADILTDMVDTTENAAQASEGFLLVRMMTVRKPRFVVYQWAHRIVPHTDTSFLWPTIGTGNIEQTLKGTPMQGSLQVPASGYADTQPRLGEYAIVEYNTYSKEPYFMTWVNGKDSTLVTGFQQYQRWKSFPDQVRAASEANQILCDKAQDPLMRLAALYTIRRQLVVSISAGNPNATRMAHAFHMTELDLLTSPGLPQMLTLGILRNIAENWTSGQYTPMEKNYATHYLIAMIRGNHTHWKISAAVATIGRQTIENHPDKTTDYYPEICHVLEQRVACDKARTSLFPGVVSGYSKPYDTRIDGTFMPIDLTVLEMQEEIRRSLSPKSKRKIIMHSLPPQPNDDLMRKLLIAAEK